jgi:photosystem II stability/assembly factor-like uncharacterized protein
MKSLSYGLTLVFLLMTVKMTGESDAIITHDIENSKFISASFVSDEFAWLVIRNGRDLVRTFSGGRQWGTISGEAVNGFGEISFINRLDGWATGSKGSVWKTTNGGEVWEFIAKLDPHSERGFIATQAKFIDKDHGWILEVPHYLWQTKDGGKHWQVSPILNENEKRYADIVKFTFTDPETGWLACERSTVLKTTDGGKKWKVLKIPTDQLNLTVHDIVFVSDNVGWVLVGDNVYQTLDGGESWRLQSPSQSRPVISSLFFLDENNGWAAGYSNIFVENVRSADEIKGKILRTSDGGRTWSEVWVNTSEKQYYYVHFSDQIHGWLISADKVYRTNNAGRSWGIVYKIPVVD